MSRRRPAPAAARVCKYCGCTDDEACPGGCAWAFDEGDPGGEDGAVCTRCDELAVEMGYAALEAFVEFEGQVRRR